MKLWFALLIVAAAFVALHYLLIPIVQERWRSSGTLQKYARIGSIAALKTLEDFLKIALIVYAAAFFVLTLLSLFAPTFGAGLLDATYLLIAKVERVTTPMRDLFGNLLLWIALLALFWAAWRMRRGDISAALDAERRRQIDTVFADDRALEELPPTPQMDQIARNIATCDALAAELAQSDGTAAQERLKQLLDMRDSMVSQYTFLDIDRRIDLSAVAVDTDARVPAGPWGWLRLSLFSKGTQLGVAATGKLFKRIGTSAACLLVIGVSTPVLAKSGLLPTLGSINDLQVFRTQDAAQKSLRQIARAAAPVRTPAEEEDVGEGAGASTAYRAAARQFALALASSTDWRGSLARVDPDVVQPAALRQADRLLEEVAIRDALLRDFAANAAERATPLRGAGFADEAAMPEAARRQYGDYRAFVARQAIVPEHEPVVDRIERWIRAKADASPAFRNRLSTGLASFRQPATLGDMFGSVLDDVLSSSIETALPDPRSGDLFTARGIEAGRDGLQDPAARIIQTKLAYFLNDIESGRSVAASLDRVRTGRTAPAFFLQREADLGRATLAERDANAARVAATAEDLHPSLHRASPPAAAGRIEQSVTRLQQLVSSGSEARAVLEGSVGAYDDLFPGRAQAIDESPLGRVLAKAFGASTPLPPSVVNAAADAVDVIAALGENLGGASGGGSKAVNGSGAGKSASAGLSSRSFARLRGSVRVGGVLIGSPPEGGNSLDVRDISWTRAGPDLKLFLRTGGREVAVGQFSGEMIQQALAYAADARPTTVTMTSGPLMPGILRVHLHPALADTALGCEMMELDRFVDAATGEWKGRTLWSGRVSTQLAIYNGATGDPSAFDRYERAGASQFLMAVNAALPDSWREGDAATSVFAHDPARFDPALVQRMKVCRPQATDGPGAYMSCVRQASSDSSRYPPQPYAIWSGVRETAYPLSLPSLTQRADGATDQQRVRFMLQVAFERDPPCDTESCEGAGAATPWEFPVIAPEIAKRTQAFAQASPAARRIWAEANKFTTLQRLFRVALAGGLGGGFPRHKLIALMNDAATIDPVDATPTPDWNQPRALAQQMLAFMRNRPGALSPGTPPAISEAQLDYLASVLSPGSGERFSGSETCRGGALALR